MKARGLVVGFALGTAVTLAGVTLFRAAPRDAHASGHLGRRGFSRALDAVLDRYVDPVDDDKLLARGLKHIVGGLDPHSYYLTADERKAIRRRGRGQTGLSVALRTGTRPGERWLEVLSVAPGSPASKADISAGDHVLAVRDHDVTRLLSQIEAESLLRGRDGETIALSVQRKREPAPVPVALTLAPAKGKTVQARRVERSGRSFGLVRISSFRTGTGERVKRSLAKLRRAAGRDGLAGVVLDLRGNPGGEVDEALVVADLFVETGVLTRTRGRGGRILREERAHAAGTDTKTPIVVLQDRHSASAAELLAVALQENQRASVVGERSYGKGTVQDVIGVEDGSVLSLTIARYFSPKDQVIDGVGVKPDHHVVLSATTPASGDAGLDAALGLFAAASGG